MQKDVTFRIEINRIAPLMQIFLDTFIEQWYLMLIR